MLSTRELVKSSKALNAQRPVRNTPRMVSQLKSQLPEELPTVFVLVLVNNHTSVWGSWYDPGSATWGYACCQSIIHVSYCAGQAGIEAARASSAQNLLAGGDSNPANEEPPRSVEANDGPSNTKVDQNYSKQRVGEGEVKLDPQKLARAINAEKKRGRGVDEEEDSLGRKKKKGFGAGSHDVTEEELGTLIFCLGFGVFSTISFAEAYRMQRRITDDPMANYVDED